MADLVAEYAAQAADLEAVDSPYTETEARGQFVDRFLTILGWDVHNLAGEPQVLREVVLERTGDEESAVIGRPDYRLRCAGRDRIPVEAKKPSVRIAASSAGAVQARSYGWSLSLPAAVLTNMAETVIYDATVTPEDGDGADVAVIPGCRFSAAEYVARFDELWTRLSFESVVSANFFDVYSYSEPPRGSSAFDLSFLEEFRRWRLRVARDIAEHNTSLPAAEVGRRTQRLLNALLFLRVCEDRNIGQYEALLHSAQDKKVLEAFRSADRVFNAGLFDVLDGTNVTPETILAVVREMYWPRSKFAFGVLRPDILAALYEQYLAERVEIPPNLRAKLVPKPELTHAGGVVPTPGWVVSDLVAEGLDPVLEPGQPVPADLAVCDLACGSGVFLVETLELLSAAQEAAGVPDSLEERARLAKTHLFGVDIDGAALEVAKLSVLLAVLGEEVVDTRRVRQLLPDLGDNLVVGNSLIGPDFDKIVPTAAAIPERRAAVAPLDLGGAFRAVMDAGGFSLVVGNPPYIRIQTLSEFLPDQLAYFQDPRSGLVSAQAYNFDVYQLFVERAVGLLADDGRLAYIVPNRFTNGLAGATVRSLLGPRIERMVHFGEEQVFERRTTYTALVFAGARSTAPAIFELVSDLDAWRAGAVSERVEIERASLTSDPWPIASEAQAKVFEAMERAAVARLGDTVSVFVGVQTSADDVYFIVPDEARSTTQLVRFTDDSGSDWEIERAILRPALRDRRLKPYDANPVPDALALFPYRVDPPAPNRKRGTATVHDRSTMAALYPKALEYLTAKRAKLVARDISPDPGEAFWAYGRSQSLTKLDDPKLIVRVLSLVPRYALDEEGLLVPGGGDGGPYYLLRPGGDCPYSLPVVQAVLSHPAVDAFVASRGKAYRGSYVVHRKRFLIDIPLPRLSSESQAGIDAAVREMHSINARLAEELDTAIRTSLDGRLDVLRSQVEDEITAAYGLSGDDLSALLG
jgi:hypothetical protein